METGIDPKVDYVFKRIFGDEANASILVDLLNAVLCFPVGKMIRGVHILNPFVAKDFAEGKVPVLDVRARDDPGRQFLLEMQRALHSGFVKRELYYWASGHAEQLLKGDHYEMLHPTFAICFVNEALYDDEDYHHIFRVYDEKNKIVFSKDLEIHILELSKFNVPVEEVKTPLERWCYFLKHGVSLDPDKLPATLDFPMTRKAVEVLVRVSQDEIERQRYLERKRVERDAASLAEYARVARDVGREEGIEKGTWIGKIQTLQQVLQQPKTPNDELSKLTEQNLMQMEEALQRQLDGKKETNGPAPSDKP